MTDKNDETEPGRDAVEPEDAENSANPPADEPEPEPKRGSVRYQDAETTVPREPTLAEKRAMRRAEQEEEEREQTEVVEVERKSLRRRRVMIGAGVAVGLAATVAVWYAAATPNEVTASCVDDGNTLSSDENICDENYVTRAATPRAASTTCPSAAVATAATTTTTAAASTRRPGTWRVARPPRPAATPRSRAAPRARRFSAAVSA
jgi:hypothetical protein